MSQNAQQAIWLTQDAYDKLKSELDQLSGPGRAEVAAKIAAAREEGDLRENGGYHAAREEQGQQEARIRQLTDMLRRAEIGEPSASADVVRPFPNGALPFLRYALFGLAQAGLSGQLPGSIRCPT